MKQLLSLIKVSLNHDMNIFKINTKKQSKIAKVLVPSLFAIYIAILMGVYSVKLTNLLKPLHLEFIALSIFAIGISFITLIEGIYKSGSLLFNCKDDNLLLSLPIKKSTVLFIRIFKFYAFELLYNSLFIIPSMIIYAYYIHPAWTYYLSSFIALLLFPIVPIVISCIIGFIITFLSSKFKGKKIIETIFSLLLVLGLMYISFKSEGFISNITKQATSINEVITKFYYPVGAYISLATDFKISTLLLFIISHLIIAVITIFILGKIYFNINSSVKRVITSHKNSKYKIITKSKEKAFIKKEINKYITTPVFIVNSGFGIVLFIIICITLCTKYDSITSGLVATEAIKAADEIKRVMPLIMFGIISFSALMTYITSSMISLEGKTFNLLKSLPLHPIEIIKYKIKTALSLIIPFLLIGDLIIIIKFKFNIISALLTIIASIILPIVSQLIGIIINLKYPKMDATNDTEIVKQSMSSLVSTFIGLGLTAVTIISLFYLVEKINTNLLILIYILIYSIIALALWILLVKNAERMFNNIK